MNALNNNEAKNHFQNEWVSAQPWVKTVSNGFMPMVGKDEAHYKPLPTYELAMEKAKARREQLIEMWK